MGNTPAIGSAQAVVLVLMGEAIGISIRLQLLCIEVIVIDEHTMSVRQMHCLSFMSRGLSKSMNPSMNCLE